MYWAAHHSHNHMSFTMLKVFYNVVFLKLEWSSLINKNCYKQERTTQVTGLSFKKFLSALKLGVAYSCCSKTCKLSGRSTRMDLWEQDVLTHHIRGLILTIMRKYIDHAVTCYSLFDKTKIKATIMNMYHDCRNDTDLNMFDAWSNPSVTFKS